MALPDAESIEISLKECNQKLSLKPSDFVSAEPPTFFIRHSVPGTYLLFQLLPEELRKIRSGRPVLSASLGSGRCIGRPREA